MSQQKKFFKLQNADNNMMLSLVYFDQQSGALHAICWLKYTTGINLYYSTFRDRYLDPV